MGLVLFGALWGVFYLGFIFIYLGAFGSIWGPGTHWGGRVGLFWPILSIKIYYIEQKKRNKKKRHETHTRLFLKNDHYHKIRTRLFSKVYLVQWSWWHMLSNLAS